jgi:hypothetical protein
MNILKKLETVKSEQRGVIFLTNLQMWNSDEHSQNKFEVSQQHKTFDYKFSVEKSKKNLKLKSLKNINDNKSIKIRNIKYKIFKILKQES